LRRGSIEPPVTADLPAATTAINCSPSEANGFCVSRCVPTRDDAGLCNGLRVATAARSGASAGSACDRLAADVIAFCRPREILPGELRELHDLHLTRRLGGGTTGRRVFVGTV
jgi:hypothetical protein